MKDVSLKDLLESGAHFGHQANRWHPKANVNLYGARDGVHIFDLVKTKQALETACRFVETLTSEGKTVIFVGTKRQAQAIVIEEAKKAEMPYVANRWLGGTISNWDQIKKSLEKLTEMTRKREAGEFKVYTKKEQALFDQEITRLNRRVGGLMGLKEPPAAIFVADLKKDLAAVKEARRKEIPIIAIADSNVDPNLAEYPIPANDDAIGALKLIVGAIGEAAKIGKVSWLKKQTEITKKAAKK